MAIRRIRKEGDPVLRTVCKPVTQFDESLCRLLDDMQETLKDAGGVGLAAPQVTYIMHDLKARGADVDVDATTIEEAAEEIARVWKAKHS